MFTALAKEPQQRFGSVKAFATALEQAYQAVLSRPAASAFEIPILRQPTLPTDAVVAVSPNQSSQPTNMVTPPSQILQPTDAVTSSSAPSVSSPSKGESIPPDEPQPLKRGISRRTVVLGLTGLVVAGAVGSSITWLAHSRSSGTTKGSSTGGTTHIAWLSENDDSGAYQQIVDNYNRINKDGISVTRINGPVSTNELLTNYHTMLRARRSTFDVMSFDTVYTAEFAQNQWIVALDDKWPQSERVNYFPGTIKSSTLSAWAGSAKNRSNCRSVDCHITECLH